MNIVLCIMYIMYIMYMTYMTYIIRTVYIYGKHAGKKLGSLLYTCIYIFDAFELYSNIQHAFIHV